MKEIISSNVMVRKRFSMKKMLEKKRLHLGNLFPGK
ncbi:hypothetical protein J2S25_002883 [Mesobacillus stamsii]|uniref:Fur-regulated basic protein FbpA n=1 Tax=Mesobacillus stamsii TaxID=225347 RepID=A0ABU0FXL6_9BACI|nr:hypothetical protein [Mesobacillus stamsii]